MGPPRGSWASGESGGTSRLNVDEVNSLCDLVAEREAQRSTVSIANELNKKHVNTHHHTPRRGARNGLLCGVGLQRADFATRLCASVYQTDIDGIALWRVPCGHAVDWLFRG